MGKKVSVLCPNCGARCEDELDQLPSPNICAETANESRDCIGGVLYKDFNLEFTSPMINLEMSNEDFVIFCKRFGRNNDRQRVC